MVDKKAAGLIIYRNFENQIEYLLLQTSYGENHWTPPKGHLDDGEEDITAAVRETQEEAGLVEEKDYVFMSRTFTIESNYVIKNGEKQKKKRVLYWLAEAKYPNVKIVLSHEHINFRWLKLDDACDIVNYDEMKRVLGVAETYIKDSIKI